MTTLLDSFQAASSPQLLSRFTAAVYKAATVIVNEDPATVGHAARIAWAARAMLTNGAAQIYASMTMRLAFSENVILQQEWVTDTNAGTAVLDVDIQNSVNGYVTKYIAAGV